VESMPPRRAVSYVCGEASSDGCLCSDSGRSSVYRFSSVHDSCSVTDATSGVSYSCSNRRDAPSCRRSWKCRSSIPSLAHDGVMFAKRLSNDETNALYIVALYYVLRLSEIREKVVYHSEGVLL